MQTDEINVIQFLTEEYERCLSFNYLCGYIFALKNHLPSHILDANVVNKFKKCLFKLRLPKTKYHAIWDVNILLNFLENMRRDSDLDISSKLVCSCYCQVSHLLLSISHLKITNMYLTDAECTFVFDDVLKHSRPSFKEKPLVFRAFPEIPKLCPVYTLMQYLVIRLSRSSDTALFLTTVRPYKGASSDTIAHWIKNTIQEAGINTGLFHPIVADQLPQGKLMLVVPALQLNYSQQVALELLPSKSFI